MICNRCKTDNEKGATFCTKCGISLTNNYNHPIKNPDNFKERCSIAFWIACLSLFFSFFLNVLSGLVFSMFSLSLVFMERGSITTKHLKIVIIIDVVNILIVIGYLIFIEM